ncbi:MAG: hypothetical protein IJT62_01135 [Oscillospiraceae bacterium]|nr:hypothetical protein [Oscillospiraceae bacterium]
MKATISDPDLGIYEIEVPDDDSAAIAEIEQFTRENTRMIRNAERRERYHAPYHLEALEFESGSLAYHETPEQILLRKEREEEYQLALATLTPAQYRRFEMWMDGLSCREIADIEEADFSSVAESISAARKKLKKVL